MSLKNVPLYTQAKLLVVNVLKYFEKESLMCVHNIAVSAVIKRTAAACGISERSVLRIKKTLKSGECPSSPKKKKFVKTKSLDVDNFVKDGVKRKIYELNMKGQHFTINSLVKTFKDDGLFEFSDTSLRRLIKELGFKYKIHDNRQHLMEQSHIAADRARFLREYFENKNENIYDPVFLDETWIFQKGGELKCWQDETVRQRKTKFLNPGKRYIILHSGNKDGFIPNASLISSSKKKTDDYHDNMNADLFKKWFEGKLIPNLEKPSLIIMDNAKYHSRLLEPIPNMSWKMEQLQRYLKSKNIHYHEKMSITELLHLTKQHVINKTYEIDSLAMEHGHKVLRLPPYHCVFNPIELVWANCKTYYNKRIRAEEKIMDDVVLRLWEEALAKVDKEDWQKNISHAEKKMLEWWTTQEQNENLQHPIIISLDESDSEAISSSEECLE